MHWVKKASRLPALQVAFCLTLYLLLADHLPVATHQGLYTVSVLIKDLLIWLLPLTVGIFIGSAISKFEQKAPLFILTLFLFEAVSNFSSVWYAYAGASFVRDSLPPLAVTEISSFEPFWRIPFLKPSWWSPEKGTLLGVCVGIATLFSPLRFLKTPLEKGKKVAEKLLTRVFAPLIPLFVVGFVARMHQTHLLTTLFQESSLLVGALTLLLLTYLALLFLIGNRGSIKKTLQAVQNLAPAAGIAFTSGCSLSTMPWTIAGAEKNLKNPHLAKIIIPATTNIQQIGDCIGNAFLCFLIYTHFFGHPPDLTTWVQFSALFTLARFATAAVLGGAIFIMLPIYESYLSFTPEMIALILAFNILLDPLITSCNVIANGALCPIFETLWNWISKPKTTPSNAPP